MIGPFKFQDYATADIAASIAFSHLTLRLGTDIPDGLTNTILAGETIPYHSRFKNLMAYGSWPTSRAALGITIVPINYDSSCTNWSAAGTPNGACTPCPGALGAHSYTGYQTSLGFKSRHPGGANFLFCDGSVHFLSENINHTMYQYMGARNEGQVIDSSGL